MADRGLDRCPMCKYDLTGLPLEHRCPECGFQYDEHTRVWRPKDRRRSIIMAVFALASLVMIPFEIWRMLSGRYPVRSILFWGMAMLVSAMVYGLVNAYRTLGVMRLVATTPVGLAIRQVRGATLMLPWGLVHRVEISGGRHKATTLLLSTNAQLDLEDIVGVDEWATEFQEAVADGKQRYLSRAAAASVESDK